MSGKTGCPCQTLMTHLVQSTCKIGLLSDCALRMKLTRYWLLTDPYGTTQSSFAHKFVKSVKNGYPVKNC